MQCARKGLDALKDVLSKNDFSFVLPGQQIDEGFFHAVHVVDHGEASNHQALGNYLHVVGKTAGTIGVDIAGNSTTGDDARMAVGHTKYRIQRLTADTIEVDVDPIRRRGLQVTGKVFRPLIDSGMQFQLIAQVVTLLGAARNTHHTAALQFGDLRHYVANRSCR